MQDVELITFGIFEAEADNQDKAYNERSPKGYFYKPKRARLLLQTDKVPLEKNISFGINYRVNNPGIYPLILRICHPEMENPETNYCFTETVDFSTEGEVGFFLHTFEFNWEMLAGFWTFQLIFNEKILLEKEFEIYVQAVAEEEDENFFYDL